MVALLKMRCLWKQRKNKPRRPFTGSSTSGRLKREIHGSIWMINHRIARHYQQPSCRFPFQPPFMTFPASIPEPIMVTFQQPIFFDQHPLTTSLSLSMFFILMMNNLFLCLNSILFCRWLSFFSTRFPNKRPEYSFVPGGGSYFCVRYERSCFFVFCFFFYFILYKLAWVCMF